MRDGNLLIKCKNEDQKERAWRVKNVGKYKVVSRVSIRITGGMGVRVGEDQSKMRQILMVGD